MASKLAVPREAINKNPRQRLEILNWLCIQDEIDRAALTQTFKILNLGKPEELASHMPVNKKSLRILEHKKLDTKPRWLNKNKIIKKCFRSRAYLYNTLPKSLTTLVELKKFKKGLKEYLKTRKR